MLISNFHKSVIVINSIETRFSRNVFEVVQYTRGSGFIGVSSHKAKPSGFIPRENPPARLLNIT